MSDTIASIPDYKVESSVSILAEKMDYNHRMMNIPEMWKETRGEGVKVVVLDTGLPQHSDLSPCGSKSFVKGYLTDRQGHASHVGGIIAAIADNGMGVAGIAPECEDYYGAVLGANGNGSIDGIIKGIRWAVDDIGATVINMSLGIAHGARHEKKLERACEYAYDQGVTVVCAAGNEHGRVGQPACYDSVLSIAAVDSKYKKAKFSNTGKEVDFAAGGVNVYSTYLRNSYSRLSGTSMACPAITGVVALIQSDFYKDYGRFLKPAEVLERLKKISFDVGNDGLDEKFGYGIPVFKVPDEVVIPKTTGMTARQIFLMIEKRKTEVLESFEGSDEEAILVATVEAGILASELASGM